MASKEDFEQIKDKLENFEDVFLIGYDEEDPNLIYTIYVEWTDVFDKEVRLYQDEELVMEGYYVGVIDFLENNLNAWDIAKWEVVEEETPAVILAEEEPRSYIEPDKEIKQIIKSVREKHYIIKDDDYETVFLSYSPTKRIYYHNTIDWIVFMLRGILKATTSRELTKKKLTEEIRRHLEADKT